MQVKIQKIDQLKRILNITIDGERFLKDKNSIYLDLGKNLKVPGFREGNAPLDILEKNYGKFLREEFLKRMIPVYCDEAFSENNLEVINLSKVYDLNFTKDALTFNVEVEIKPQINIEEKIYKGIKIKDIKIEVKEEEIEKFLTNIKEEIKRHIEKDLDDEMLAKWLSYPDMNSLREAIRSEIFIQKTIDRKRKITNQITKHLLNQVKFQVPHSQVKSQEEELLKQNINELKLRGVREEDIEKYKKDLEQKLLPIAEEQVKLYYILDIIKKQENIKVENELFDVVIGFILSNANYGG